MHSAVFEATISAGERPPTHALDRAATGIGLREKYTRQNMSSGGSEEIIHFKQQTTPSSSDDSHTALYGTQRQTVTFTVPTLEPILS